MMLCPSSKGDPHLCPDTRFCYDVLRIDRVAIDDTPYDAAFQF